MCGTRVFLGQKRFSEILLLNIKICLLEYLKNKLASRYISWAYWLLNIYFWEKKINILAREKSWWSWIQFKEHTLVSWTLLKHPTGKIIPRSPISEEGHSLEHFHNSTWRERWGWSDHYQRWSCQEWIPKAFNSMFTKSAIQYYSVHHQLIFSSKPSLQDQLGL